MTVVLSSAARATTALVASLFLVTAVALLGCNLKHHDEPILFSVIGNRPFADSIFTIRPDGTGLKEILKGAGRTSYLYASGYTRSGSLLVVVHEAQENGQAKDALRLYDQATKKWTSVGTPEGSVGRGVISPDRANLVFAYLSGKEPGFYKLFLMNLGTEKVKGPLGGEEHEREGYATWNPDGTEIVFIGLRLTSGHLVTRVVRYVVKTEQALELVGPQDVPGAAAYSPDGHRICLLSKRGIEVIGVDGRDRSIILPWKDLPSSYGGFRFGCLSWSSSDLIAFAISNKETKKSELWTVRSDGSKPTLLRTIDDGSIEGVFFLRD